MVPGIILGVTIEARIVVFPSDSTAKDGDLQVGSFFTPTLLSQEPMMIDS
jgi:hypothetical protein